MGKLLDALASMAPSVESISHSDTLNSSSHRISAIRQHAEQFSEWCPELPSNKDELTVTLWKFGDQLNGEMEKRMNHILQVAMMQLVLIMFQYT